MTTFQDNDELLPLGFALHSAPGAYALLLGAGISAASGIPTAWGMLTELTARVAHLHGEAPDDPIGWYESAFGTLVRYETLLERLAGTPQERQQLLRPFFEPDPGPDADATAGPTLAHKAIARLVADGVIRVIVTLNFDRLLEQALHDLHIEPVVIATAEDAAGMAPLHTLDCCVIHLHGDYKNPKSMLNTVDELSDYSPPMADLLTKVLREYGVVAAGWSGEWDPALRAAISAEYPGRYTLTWIEPRDPAPTARELCTAKAGQFVRRTGDQAFGFLADAVASMRSRDVRHPLSVSTAASTAKRELSGRWVAIGLHDTWGREISALHDLPELNLSGRENMGDLGGQGTLDARVDEAVQVPAALVAAIAYWGDDSAQQWWLRELPRLAIPSNDSGLQALTHLPLRAAAALYWSAGVAAVAAGRLDLLRQLMNVRTTRPGREGDVLLASLLDELGAPSYSQLGPMLQTALETGSRHIEDSWQVFEIVRLSALTTTARDYYKRRDQWRAQDTRLKTLRYAFDKAEAGEGGDVDQARRARAEAVQDVGRARGALAGLVPMRDPHLLTGRVDLDSPRQALVAERLLRELLREGSLHPIVKAHLGDVDNLTVSIRAVSDAAGRRASTLADRHTGSAPGEMWLDTPSVPGSRQ